MIAQAQADVTAARVNSDLADKEFERSAALAARGFATQQKNDQTESTLTQARSTVASKQAVLDAARQKVATLKAQIGQAGRNSTRPGKAQPGPARPQDTVVRSTIAGRVGDRTVRSASSCSRARGC